MVFPPSFYSQPGPLFSFMTFGPHFLTSLQWMSDKRSNIDVTNSPSLAQCQTKIENAKGCQNARTPCLSLSLTRRYSLCMSEAEEAPSIIRWPCLCCSLCSLFPSSSNNVETNPLASVRHTPYTGCYCHGSEAGQFSLSAVLWVVTKDEFNYYRVSQG